MLKFTPHLTEGMKELKTSSLLGLLASVAGVLADSPEGAQASSSTPSLNQPLVQLLHKAAPVLVHRATQTCKDLDRAVAESKARGEPAAAMTIRLRPEWTLWEEARKAFELPGSLVRQEDQAAVREALRHLERHRVSRVFVRQGSEEEQDKKDAAADSKSETGA